MQRILDRKPRIIPNFAMRNPEDQALAELAVLSGVPPTVRAMTALFTESPEQYLNQLRRGGPNG